MFSFAGLRVSFFLFICLVCCRLFVLGGLAFSFAGLRVSFDLFIYLFVCGRAAA